MGQKIKRFGDLNGNGKPGPALDMFKVFGRTGPPTLGGRGCHFGP